MSNWKDQSTVGDYLANIIITELVRDGRSDTLDEILNEHCDKDDIIESYPEAFKEEESL